MSDEKKIIIDEDWKATVAAEREAFERTHQPDAPQASDAAEESQPEAQAPPEQSQMPPASFELLVTMFASEAMTGLGQIPHPLTGKVERDLAQARYAIDMLDILAEKTNGNLTPEEDTGLKSLVHQLRMVFLAAKQ